MRKQLASLELGQSVNIHFLKLLKCDSPVSPAHLTAFEACFLLRHFLVEVSQVIQGSYKDAHWYSEPEVG